MDSLYEEILEDQRTAKRNGVCYLCDGVGSWVDDGKTVSCPDCETRAEGKVRCEICRDRGGWQIDDRWVVCASCEAKHGKKESR